MTSKYFSGGQDGGREECWDERWTMKSLPKMSRGQIAGQVPLPDGWDVEKDVDGRRVFIDHNTKQTTWVDPRDRHTKPASFADCLGDELPYGWEQAFDAKIGTYFINHLTKTNQIEDPRLKWREEQEKMLREYLADANQDLMAKKQILSVKNERLTLANEEVLNLTEKLAHWKASGTSLNSASSFGSTKYDPDLLRADIAHARNRVVRLKQELDNVRTSMQYTEKGLETLQQVNDKMVENQNMYNVEEAQAVLRNISELSKSLVTSEKEKQDLLLSVARLKEDVLRAELRTGSSPNVSTLLLPQERNNTASQTDLSGESSSHLGELVRLKLQHDEAKNRMFHLQMELANIESQLIPGQLESDRDRLILIAEKEQLLRELRSLNLRRRPMEEVNTIQLRVHELEDDLRREIEEANQLMAMKNVRLELNHAKCNILQNLAETAKLVTQLEIKIRTLSLSTTSISSGSSLGSLGSLSASSRGSQNSMALSLTDIYSLQGHWTPEVNLPELHRRVERLLQGANRNFVSIPEDAASSSDIPCGLASDGFGFVATDLPPTAAESHGLFTSRFESCSLPSYEEHIERQRSLANLNLSQELAACSYSNTTANDEASVDQSLNELHRSTSFVLMTNPEKIICGDEYLSDGQHQLCVPYYDCFVDKTDKISNPPLSPISESSSGVCNVLYYSSNTHSVSAAMSDDSITGGSDSGVSESNVIYRSKDGEGMLPLCQDSAQVQIKIQYVKASSTVEIKIEQTKNLSVLCHSDSLCKVYFRVSLLPSTSSSELQLTQLKGLFGDPAFEDIFIFHVIETKLFSKTVKVQCCCTDGGLEELCCGVVLISLASFDLNAESINWYNILNLNFISCDHDYMPSSYLNCLRHSELSSVPLNLKHPASNMEPVTEDMAIASSADKKMESVTKSDRSCSKNSPQTSCSAAAPLKEESSDESTVISSQTSTLTRNHETEELDCQKVRDDDDDDEDDDDEQKQYCTLMSSKADDEENESADECEDDAEGNSDERLLCLKEYTLKNVWLSKLGIGRNLPTQQSSVSGLNYAASDDDGCSNVATVKCDKETNTDLSSNLSGANRLSRQSHDMIRGSTIRRWQTFSPTPAGAMGEDLGCKLSRSGSDSFVRNRKSHFERHASERQSVRLKKSSVGLAKTSHSCYKTRNRTSIDLELDLQAHRVRLAHLNEDIVSLKELKRRLEESKEKGESEPCWLMENEPLQQFLTLTDRMIPRHERRHNMSNVDELTQHKMRKAKKEAEKLQMSQKNSQPNEVTFRKKMAFFTTMMPHVPAISSDDSAVDAADGVDSCSATYCQRRGETLSDRTTSLCLQLTIEENTDVLLAADELAAGSCVSTSDFENPSDDLHNG